MREITGGKGVDAAVDPVGGELAGQVSQPVGALFLPCTRIDGATRRWALSAASSPVRRSLNWHTPVCDLFLGGDRLREGRRRGGGPCRLRARRSGGVLLEIHDLI